MGDCNSILQTAESCRIYVELQAAGYKQSVPDGIVIKKFALSDLDNH